MKNLQLLAGSFSAVSKQNVGRKYAFSTTFQDLEDLHTFALFQPQHVSKIMFTNQQFS